MKTLFNKKTWTSIKKGVEKGNSIEILPLSISKFYTSLWLRGLRVIGGICTVAVVTKTYQNMNLPEALIYILYTITIIHLLQIIVMSIVKVYYTLKKLYYHSEEFEVRNSPLDKDTYN